jgi:hypothetical protein
MRTLALAALVVTTGCTAVLGVEEVQPITDHDAARLDGDQAPHGFGDVVTGQTSTIYTVSIKNAGTAATGALATALTGEGFVIAADRCDGVVLAPTEVCTIDVQFQPTTPGAAHAAVEVSASPGGALRFELTGTAYAPGDLAFDATTHDFLIVDAGTASAGTTFTLTNRGGSPTGALSTTIGGDSAQFTVMSDQCHGMTLAPGASCAIQIQFAPATYGAFTLSLLATASPGGAASVSLGGTGQTHATLTATRAGDGTGTIAAAGLTCTGATCTGSYARTGVAPSVQLTATPATGVTLAWSGDCAGTASACTVVMDRDRSATATFTIIKNTLTVATRLVGGAFGKVTSSPSGIDCGATCTHTYASTASVTLTASPNGTAVFQGWTGDCAGQAKACVVAMTAARSVTATFKPPVNYIFATSKDYPTTGFGGLAGADDICQSHAAAAGLPGTFVAFLSTSTVNAKDRVGAARGWIRVDGKPVIDSLATTLATGQIFYSPALDELGAPADIGAVMTGTKPDGTVDAGYTCSDYTSPSGSVTIGGARDGAFNWLALGGSDCSAGFRIWCLQTDYTTPLQMPPLSNPIAFVTKDYFDTATGLAAADAMCRTDATSAGLPDADSYKALLGTHAMAPASRFSSTYTFKRTDDVPLNASGDSFFDKTKTWFAPLDVTADKTYFHGADIAIGSLDPTVIGANTCNDWTVDTAAAKLDGVQTYNPNPFHYSGTHDCTKFAKVICLYSNQ